MSDIHDMPGHVIRRLNQISTSVFNEGVRAAGFDLTAVQFAALAVIAETPGLDQARLAGAIAYDRATIGGVVDRLEAKGLIERRVSPTDRRARALSATEAGRALLERIRPVVRALQPRILSGLDDKEQELFLALARKAAEGGNALSRAPLLPL